VKGGLKKKELRLMNRRHTSSRWDRWIDIKDKRCISELIELIAKEFDDAMATPNKTSQNQNI